MNKSIAIFLLGVQFAVVIGLNDIFRGKLHRFAVKNKTNIEQFNLYVENEEEVYDTQQSNDATKGCAAAALIRHNFYRQIHEVPPLVLSEKLNEYSKRRADSLANENTIYHHVPNYTYGENVLYFRSLEGIHDLSFVAVEEWYEGIEYFDFNWEEGVMSAASRAHEFTQLIWKDTKELGAGAAKSENGGVFLVCLYDPPGNIIGQFMKNVNPPTER
ncbi:Golgi-associated plant pathogenesis-related protein 1-like [Adelges cooleyi]|uniref:Golgi-associated plant pathogenesis-related protein 1-like n=1 Tax=Adelges cooleyi TaxID=133065 RepID=UPI00217FE6C2|nr:Golgi-associated plant pathogenesis-related protein 1-like [Adelges cooleyi]